MMLCYESTAAREIFANPLVHHLGVVSYSLYLIHPLVAAVNLHLATVAAREVGAFGQPAVAMAEILLTWAAAALLYRSIEMPGRVYLQRIVARSRVGQAWS
jgi:peptidoglycan/LPS O-acetylase OafA/YrhL